MSRRSTRIRDSACSADLINLELSLIDNESPIEFTGRKPRLNIGVTASKPKPIKLDPIFTEPELISNPNDPLNPAAFLGHHRRQEREEKRMQHIERERLDAEAERIDEQRAQLSGVSWRKAITHIVRLDNPKDLNELNLKRKEALREMNLFMFRYERMKQGDRKRRRSSIDQHLSDRARSDSPTKRPRTSIKRSKVGGGKGHVAVAKLKTQSLRNQFHKLDTRLSGKLPRGWHPRVVKSSGLTVLIDLRGRNRLGQRPKKR